MYYVSYLYKVSSESACSFARILNYVSIGDNFQILAFILSGFLHVECTFYVFFRFGILALDEPTTNLDQENVRSLCSALGEIVQERMKQKNFMFVIITHDREFIESLGNIDKVTHFYEVSRNDEGKSRIKKIRFS